MDMQNIRDGEIRAAVRNEPVILADGGRRLTPREQTEHGLYGEEVCYWLMAGRRAADGSPLPDALPRPDVECEDSCAWLAATLARHDIDPDTIRWDDVDWVYRREPPEEIAIEARGHTARLRQGGIVEIDAPDQRAGTGCWYDGAIRDCAARLEDEIYAALDDALQAALDEMGSDVQELFEFRRD